MARLVIPPALPRSGPGVKVEAEQHELDIPHEARSRGKILCVGLSLAGENSNRDERQWYNEKGRSGVLPPPVQHHSPRCDLRKEARSRSFGIWAARSSWRSAKELD